jgi:flagellar biosynthesis protein FlhG
MPAVISIASGKGGVGKTFLSANLAIGLSKCAGKTLLVDCDLGGANLHHFLGLPPPDENIYHFLREKADLNKLIRPVKKNLDFIAGSSDVLGMVHIKNYEKSKLIRNFKLVDYDYVIVDLGAGSSYNVLDMFNASDIKLLVITPEQTSLENAYGFLKVAYLRELLSIVKNDRIFDLLVKQISFKSGGIKNISLIKDKLLKDKSEYLKDLEEVTRNYKVGIILNMIKKKNELSYFVLFDFIVRKYLGFNIEKIGFFPYDSFISKSLKDGNIYYDVVSEDKRGCFIDIINKIKAIAHK